MNDAPVEILKTIRQIVRQELQAHKQATLAMVVEQHTENNYACTVQLRDSEILLQQVPIVSSRTGLASIPAIDDLVLVQFIGGDINRPVILGSLYNDEDLPPPNSDGQLVFHLPQGAGQGEGVEALVNSLDIASLDIKIGASLSISLRDDDPAVTIDVGSGAATLTIDSDGALTINSGRGINLEAGTDLVLKGTNVQIEGSAEVTLQGGVINLN